MTKEQMAQYIAMEKRVLAMLRKHGPQPILQLWARIALPELQEMAEGKRSDITDCGDVASAFWRLLEQGAVRFTPDRIITLAEDARPQS